MLPVASGHLVCGGSSLSLVDPALSSSEPIILEGVADLAAATVLGDGGWPVTLVAGSVQGSLYRLALDVEGRGATATLLEQSPSSLQEVTAVAAVEHHLAVAAGGAVHFYDLDERRFVKLESLSEEVSAMAWHPTGTWLVLGLPRGLQGLTLKGESFEVTSLGDPGAPRVEVGEAHVPLLKTMKSYHSSIQHIMACYNSI